MVAAAAALVEKSARLSTRQWPEAAVALERANALRLESFELIEEDAQAYLAFVDAVRSREDTETARARTIDVPLRMIRAAANVVGLAVQLANHGNANLRADAVVGATLAAAAADGGLTLIEVNVGQGVDDARLDEARTLARQAGEGARSVRPRDS